MDKFHLGCGLYQNLIGNLCPLIIGFTGRAQIIACLNPSIARLAEQPSPAFGAYFPMFFNLHFTLRAYERFERDLTGRAEFPVFLNRFSTRRAYFWYLRFWHSDRNLYFLVNILFLLTGIFKTNEPILQLVAECWQ